MSDLTSPDPINPSNLSDPSQQWAVLSEQVATLTQRVTSLEEKLLLIPDIERYSRLQQFLSSGHFQEADI